VAVQGCKQTTQATLFVRSAWRYWAGVFPQVRAELRRWRSRAIQIPDHALRQAALEAQSTKWRDLEGAAAFAVFAPASIRKTLVRGIAAFEIAFDYLDTLTEMSNSNPVANGWQLNQALLIALEPGARHPDYYALHIRRRDGRYLEELIDSCRASITTLPSLSVVTDPARRALERIVVYQSLSHVDARDSRATFARWASSHTSAAADLYWWEIGAATGSQLLVLALLAAAADPALSPQRAVMLEHAYFPWVAALSTLLDSLIDQSRDRVEGHQNLIDYYGSSQEVVTRLQMITREALRRIAVLPDADHHIILLAAMVALFDRAAQGCAPDTRLATRAVLNAMGALATPALLIFRARNALANTGKWTAIQRDT
jgi:tetraprenyl-beta-curcumene synthase